MGQRSRVDLEWLGNGEWRCRNCDAILSEGTELLHHRHRDCRHPQSESRAVARESTCVGCRAALAQVRALREHAPAAGTTAATTAAAATDDDAGGAATGERAAECERTLWGEGAAWRRVFASSVVPEPTAEPGRGGIMGRMTAGSLARVLSALQLRTDDVFFDIGAGNGAVLGAVHLLAPTVRLAGVEADEGLLAAALRNLAALNAVAALECVAVQCTPHLGAATVAYCFSQGLKDATEGGDAAAAVLAACQATPTLRLVVVVHDAREKKHALVAFVESEGGRGRVVAELGVTMSGGKGKFRCWAVRVEPAGGAREAAVGGAELGARAGGVGGAREPAALGRGAPPCYVINHDRRTDRLLRVHKLLDGLTWLAWRRLEAVGGCGGRGGGCTPSHRAAWLRLRDEPMQECVLVLEDEVDALCDDFESRLQDLLARLAREPSWRLCLLGSHERSGPRLLARGARPSLTPLEQGQSSSVGLVGYLLHRRALPLLLDAHVSSPPHEPLGVALGTRVDWGHSARFEVAPAMMLAAQHPGAAATEPPRAPGDTPPELHVRGRGGGEGGGSRSSSRSRDGAAPSVAAPSTLALARGMVGEPVRFQRTGIEAAVEAYDAVDGLHTVSANGLTWREALVGRGAVDLVRAAAPEGPRPRAEEPSPEARALVASLEAGLVALGHWDAFPAAGGTWRAVPRGLDLAQWTRVLDVGMRAGGLAILLVTGTLVPARLHTVVLNLIAERLPDSSVIALNVGELEADAEAYDALASAAAQPSCVLGHLYFRDPVSEPERARKRRVRAQLRRNCTKPGYLAQLARGEVWALRGAHCWHNFSDALRSRALAWAGAGGRALRPPWPVRGANARVGIGRAHQAEVQAWPHGDSPTAPGAAAGTSVERGDTFVPIDEADVLRAQRATFNAALLAAEPRRRWPDAGAQRVALGPTHARQLLAYARDPANRDARGRLRLDDGRGTLLGGYGSYRATHAVEAGARHSEAEQARCTTLLAHERLDAALDGLPGLEALVEAGRRQLPEAGADGCALVPLHGHILDQGSGTARFVDHQDTEEERAPGARASDRRVVYTVVIALSDGGDTAMRVLGQETIAFTGEAGSGVAFLSELWHRTERASGCVWKLAIFYGYMLGTRRPRAEPSRAP